MGVFVNPHAKTPEGWVLNHEFDKMLKGVKVYHLRIISKDPSDFWAIPKLTEANNPIFRANPLFTFIINYTPKSRFVQILVYPFRDGE